LVKALRFFGAKRSAGKLQNDGEIDYKTYFTLLQIIIETDTGYGKSTKTIIAIKLSD